MRDVYEILREKEHAVERLRREVEALRSVAPWLTEEAATRSRVALQPSVPMEAAREMVSRQRETLRRATPLVADETRDLADKIRSPRVSPAQPITKSKPSMISPTVKENSAGQPIPPTPPFISSVSRGQGAADASAKAVSAAKMAGSEASSVFSTTSAWVPSFTGLDEHALEQTSGRKNGFVIAMLAILVIAFGAYFNSRRHEKKALEKPSATAPQVQAVPTAARVESAQEQPTTPSVPQSHVTRRSAIFAPPKATKPTPSIKSTAAEATEAGTIVALPQAAPMKVKSDLSRHTEAKPAPNDQTSLPAPTPLNISSSANMSDKALSNLVAGSPTTPPKSTPEVLNISPGVAQGLLIKKVQPIYPPQALAKRIQGLVQLQATIGRDGIITNLKVISGQDVLGQAAMEAVRQWKYQPYYLNGRPVEIQTQITVKFSAE